MGILPKAPLARRMLTHAWIRVGKHAGIRIDKPEMAQAVRNSSCEPPHSRGKTRPTSSVTHCTSRLDVVVMKKHQRANPVRISLGLRQAQGGAPG
jgi:hypothetical protein